VKFIDGNDNENILAQKLQAALASGLKFNIYWWPGRELNPRHADFQSAALPTELPGLFCLRFAFLKQGKFCSLRLRFDFVNCGGGNAWLLKVFHLWKKILTD
jgi:hypothetical protein